MSKANCCCGLSASAAAGLNVTGIETAATRRAIPKRGCNAKLLRQPCPNISLSQMAECRDQFRQGTGSLASDRTRQFCGPAILFDIFDGDDFDFHQKSGIGEGRDADDGPGRQIGLTAAEELRVAF